MMAPTPLALGLAGAILISTLPAFASSPAPQPDAGHAPASEPHILVPLPDPLAPYQMVRSLQVLQDRIADGDHAALPMQNKLLEMIDKRLRETSAKEYEDRRNFRALVIYGLSGGNPGTLQYLLGRLHLDEVDRRLLGGVHAYVSGRVRVAHALLQVFDPRMLRPELGAFLALVQGSLTARETPADALPLLDTARLLGPGTLVEEAALRRTLDLTAQLGDALRFQRAGDQYVRRFLRSPYASQFVDALISGIVRLNIKLDLDQIAGTIGLMNEEQQRFVYLRLARVSAIDGYAVLNEFAARKAKTLGASDGTVDPRAVLYSNAPSVTSDTVEETLAKLKAIDRDKLSPNDRQLLDAAEAIAKSVTAQPVTSVSANAAKLPEAAPPRVSSRGPVGYEDPTHSQLLADTRAKLEAIDAMLKDQPQ